VYCWQAAKRSHAAITELLLFHKSMGDIFRDALLGASSWLSALPIKAVGYALNKQEFTDAICMRYGWKVKYIPTHCACGETNSVDHSLICKRGGYTLIRHK